jgi:hypothetical protein
MSYADFMRAAHRKQAAQQGDHSHDVALSAALAAVNELIDQESAEDEGDQDLAPLRTARQSLLQFQTVEYAENEDGEDTNARLAKMRLILDGTKGASHRELEGTGRYVTPKIRAVTSLDMRKHLVIDHGVDPGYAGTLIGASLHALHERVHVGSTDVNVRG